VRETCLPDPLIADLSSLGEFAGDVSPRGIAGFFQDRAIRLNPAVQAFTRFSSGTEAPIRQGIDTPFFGLPISVKDSIDVAGLPTGGGITPPLVPTAEKDAACVTFFRQRGMTPIGKTSLVGLAYGSWGCETRPATPINPWSDKIALDTGGSSSGAAAAVAANLCPFAIVTDTGGSARIPAAFCGLVGIRPRQSLFPMKGVLPLCPTFDGIGFLARSMADMNFLIRRASDKAFVREPDRSSERLRIGWTTLGLVLGKDVATAFGAVISKLDAEGYDVDELEAESVFRQASEEFRTIISYEAYQLYRHLLGGRYQLDDGVAERIQGGATIARNLYEAALQRRRRAVERAQAVFAGYAAVLTPATPCAAPPITELDRKSRQVSAFTRATNYLDLSAMVIPTGMSATSKPMSVQIITRGDLPPAALAIGHILEWPWQERWRMIAARQPALA
jgi:aspartyl-tRNA(Asn)/glutamyl-tRNA(Gln) amidotransferase subunit A